MEEEKPPAYEFLNPESPARKIYDLGTTDYAYKMGFDCGKNGCNSTNCHFAIFSTPENTKAWENGKKDALLITP